MRVHGDRVDGTEVALPAPTELVRVGVEDLAPRSGVRDAEAVLRPSEQLDFSRLNRTFTLRTREGFAENYGPALLARVAAGDERAFASVYEDHRRRLYRVAYGVLLDAHEAREAVQEAFLQLHRAAPKWSRTVTSPRPGR